MRLIDYFDRGADLFPQRDCLHDGMRGWTCADVRGKTCGQAEACMIATVFSREDHVAALESNKRPRLASCGRLSPLMRPEVMADDGRLLPRGERGEIVVRATYWAGRERKI
jgi:acyl-coenzyme A synthetase/AMP-(fatty) acid ligase